MKNRLISLTLALCLLLSICPSALAAGEAPEQDNDQLFAQYVQQVFADDGRAFATGSGTAGSRLTGSAATIYQELRPQIAQVASGERASTIFTVAGSSSGVKPALHALQVDFPAEFYWFDKTVYYHVQSNGYSSVTIQLPVAAGYSATGRLSTYQTDVSRIRSVQTARNNARAVVALYAGRPDYEKLLGYKEYICDSVEYNYSAVNSYVAYGDPWQLIYVFDGDPSTDVVCEGYSKAFQYLCDLSSFSGGVQCWTVDGDMDGGAHMWNIVSLEGENYLVDVTNCDSNSIGAPDQLFLAGGSGDPYSGYNIATKHRRINYRYETGTWGMLDLYGPAILTISSESYAKKNGGDSLELSYYMPESLTVGEWVEISPVVSGGSGGTNSFSLWGSLPGGLSFDQASGTISGRPEYVKYYSTFLEITVENSLWGSASCRTALPPINARQRELTGIELASMPDKTVYEYGEEFDPAGASLRLSYSDGSYDTLNLTRDNAVYSGLSSTGADQSVSVTYEGYTTWITGITVNPRSTPSPRPTATPTPRPTTTPTPRPTATPSPTPTTSPTASPTPGCSTPTPAPQPPETSPFWDVHRSDWYYEAVIFVSAGDIMTGYPGGGFRPKEQLNRAQLAQLLYNLAGRPDMVSSVLFSDVRQDAWFNHAVTWAALNGIVNGYPNGKFGPSDMVTREQLATMLWRFAGSPAPANYSLSYPDGSSVSSYARGALCWATEKGIINGRANGKLDPKGRATRAETAQILVNLANAY